MLVPWQLNGSPMPVSGPCPGQSHGSAMAVPTVVFMKAINNTMKPAIIRSWYDSANAVCFTNLHETAY